jgi:hypothetical protein
MEVEMPNFLYLFRGGDRRSLSAQELQENMSKWGVWIKQLSQDGRFKGGDPLADTGKILSGKRKAVTDGPFGETKDVVGGYLLVTAPTLDDAIELARGCPIFEYDGSVEVRELREMTM